MSTPDPSKPKPPPTDSYPNPGELVDYHLDAPPPSGPSAVS